MIGKIGGTVGPDLSKVGGQRDSQWILTQLKDPKSHNPNTQMPAYPQLSDSELQALVEFMSSLK
jgi:cbb3-type cytochrome oxidase cytochrome c subunit